MSRDDHFELGKAHAAQGLPRYKFQDKILQERYNRGYDIGKDPIKQEAYDSLNEFRRRMQDADSRRRS